MKENEEKEVVEKITDCRRIGLLCLFVAVFLYAGTLVPQPELAIWKLKLLKLISLLFLGAAALLGRRLWILKGR
ncbi:MAG: hypothetical protein LKI94_08550 [Sporolactobacillus sp.]|nr:hypothetical protein [Sporolactobacillus sp.]MCI1882224.1 hypothetical protein [Sporolactobacillus sp.]